jgi:uncharacterized membrane protein YeaQ/YmgE (transglycosylase-associated protein family)
LVGIVGLIAGLLAGKAMTAGGYVDVILGLLGAILGGWTLGRTGLDGGDSLIRSILLAFVGAVILIWITRLVKRA